MKNINIVLPLCLVTKIKHDQSFEEYSVTIEQALQGGITMLQLREKHNDLLLIKERAHALKSLVKSYKVPLIINDFVELAAEVDADGVHIGQGDMHPKEVRDIIGPDKIIGLSIETLEELKLSNEIDEIDYVSISVVYSSKTKSDYKRVWGLEGLQEAVKYSKHPITAIGGIRLDNAIDIIHSGINGITVIGAIYDSTDPLKVASDLIKLLRNKR